MQRHPLPPPQFHGPQHQHPGSRGRHLGHLLERDLVEFAGLRDHTRVGGEDPVHIGVDLAGVGLQVGGHGHRGGVGAPPAQRGDLLVGGRDPLEAGHDDHVAFVEVVLDPEGPDLFDLGAAVDGVGDDAGLRPGEAHRLHPLVAYGHGEKGHRDALPRGEQHVHLPGMVVGAHLPGEVDELIGGVPHGRHDHHHVVPGQAGAGHAAGHGADPVGVAHRGAAVLLDDDRHRPESVPRAPYSARAMPKRSLPILVLALALLAAACGDDDAATTTAAGGRARPSTRPSTRRSGPRPRPAAPPPPPRPRP